MKRICWTRASPPNGIIWFVDPVAARLGSVDATGQITTYVLPNLGAGLPVIGSIAPASDGTVWFTQGDSVVRFSPHGTIIVVRLPKPYSMTSTLAFGPHNLLWIGQDDFGSADAFKKSTAQLEKMVAHWMMRLDSRTGHVTEFRLPSVGLNANVGDIVAGPDGNMWFDITLATIADHWIGRITPAGRITRFPLPPGSWQPSHLLVGPAGCRCLLFKKEFEPTDGEHPQIIDRIDLSGMISEYSPLALAHFTITSMALASDGHLWVDDSSRP